MCRKMSSLFNDREQQDGHECLRCILLYIQEATRAINQQRQLHRDIARSGEDDCISATADASPAAKGVVRRTNDSSLPDPLSPASSPNSALCELSPNQPDSADSVSPTAGASTVARVSPVTSERDCLFYSSSGRSSSSSQNCTLRELKPDGAKSVPSGTSLSAAAAAPKKAPSAGKITDYFASAPLAPKTVSEIAVNTSKVLDFVEALCEGKSERKTRCLECESVTCCTETFQDVEVVAQKAVNQAHTSTRNDSDSDCDDGSKKHQIYFLCVCLVVFWVLSLEERKGIKSFCRAAVGR